MNEVHFSKINFAYNIKTCSWCSTIFHPQKYHSYFDYYLRLYKSNYQNIKFVYMRHFTRTLWATKTTSMLNSSIDTIFIIAIIISGRQWRTVNGERRSLDSSWNRVLGNRLRKRAISRRLYESHAFPALD